MVPHSRRNPYLLGALVHALAVLGIPSLGLAQDNKAKCVDAYESGQRDRKQSALLQAKEAFSFCSSDACPTAMHGDCSTWLEEVEAAIPQCAFEVTDSKGARLNAVTVSVDLGPPHTLGAVPIALDPGAHLLVFEQAGYQEQRQNLVLAKRDSVVRRVVLEPLPLPPAAMPAISPAIPPEPKPEALEGSSTAKNWPAWVGLGVGSAGVASFAYFGLNGRSEDRALDACSPACSAEQVDSVRRDYLLANVSLGVGALGLLGAGAWLLFAPSPPRVAPRKAALDVQLGPITWVRQRF